MIGQLQRENSKNELKSDVKSRLKSDLIRDIDFRTLTTRNPSIFEYVVKMRISIKVKKFSNGFLTRMV